MRTRRNLLVTPALTQSALPNVSLTIRGTQPPSSNSRSQSGGRIALSPKVLQLSQRTLDKRQVTKGMLTAKASPASGS